MRQYNRRAPRFQRDVQSPSTVSSSAIASTVDRIRGSSGGRNRTSGARRSEASSAVVPEPTGIEVVGDQACDVLVVTDADGTRTEVAG